MPRPSKTPDAPQRASERPRARKPSPVDRARTLAARYDGDPDAMPRVRSALLTLADEERAERHAYAAIVQALADVRARRSTFLARQAAVSLRAKETPTGKDPLTVWYARQVGVLDLLGAAEVRAAALNAAAWPQTLRDLRSARRSLVQAMWDARRLGDAATRGELRRAYGQVCGRMTREGRRLSPDDRLLRQRLRATPPAQQLREAGDRVRLDALPRQEARTEQQERDLARHRANVLAQALWAVYQGDRPWTPFPLKPGHAQAHAPGDRTAGSLPAPEYLEVDVPAAPALGIERHRLRVHRAEYEGLLHAWGWADLVRATTLARKIHTAPGTRAEKACEELVDLALLAAPAPNLVRAWHAYLSSPRLGDVFALHSSGTMQLAPRRNGDLREAALAVLTLAKPVAFCVERP